MKREALKMLQKHNVDTVKYKNNVKWALQVNYLLEKHFLRFLKLIQSQAFSFVCRSFAFYLFVYHVVFV